MEGICRCNPGFGGDNCERVDNCVPDVNGTICSGNGYCEENTSQCVCKKNFDGARCERDICGGVYCGGESNGFCNNGTCVCYEGWGGVNCTEDLCAGKDCGHGSCYNGNCQCEWGWAGANCTEIDYCRTENPCSGHGYCNYESPAYIGGSSKTASAPGAPASLRPAAAGPASTAAAVAEVSPNGTPVKPRGARAGKVSAASPRHAASLLHSRNASSAAPTISAKTVLPGDDRKCVCYDGWFGDICDKNVCDNESWCNGRGTCDRNNGFCECQPEWTGDRCQRVRTKCDPDPCNGHGTCNIADGSCVCDYGFKSAPNTTDDCLNYVDLCEDPKFQCEGNGACNAANECTCMPGWDSSCSSPKTTASSTCLEVVSAPADGLRMYNRRCPRPFYQVLETPTGTLPNGTLVLWWNETGYRTSDCPGLDSSCWIYVFAKAGKATYNGWMPVEQPNTPGMCGTPDGGVKYAVNTTSACPTFYYY